MELSSQFRSVAGEGVESIPVEAARTLVRDSKDPAHAATVLDLDGELETGGRGAAVEVRWGGGLRGWLLGSS